MWLCTQTSIYRQWVPCERNSSYTCISYWNIAHVFSMVWRCACDLDITLAAVISNTFSTLRTLSFFMTSDSMKMLWQWIRCERSSSYNFIPIVSKLCTCFCHGLEMFIWFGYNPWINFCHFFYLVNFVIFWPQVLWKCRDSGYRVSATPHTIFIKLCTCFFATVWRCVCGLDLFLQLIFITFPLC